MLNNNICLLQERSSPDWKTGGKASPTPSHTEKRSSPVEIQVKNASPIPKDRGSTHVSEFSRKLYSHLSVNRVPRRIQKLVDEEGGRIRH